MADKISKEQRSWTMSRIRGRDTSIEVKVRKHLFRQGYRYRKNVRSLPAIPDIVLPKYKTVIFINGCFWHRHPFCRYATTPKTNTDFWLQKFDRNLANDKKHYEQLEAMGWNVIVIWQCELKKSCFETTMQRVMNELTENLYNQNGGF